MHRFNKFLLEQIILLALVSSSHCKPNWIGELTNVEIENSTPDVIAIDLYTTTVSRGVYGLTGTIDIKQDLDGDKFIIGNEMYMSRTGSKGSYVKTALYTATMSLSEFGKKIYQPYFMDSLIKCTENTWQLGQNGQLERLTKRLMKFNNCIFDNDKMPSYMMNGYYRIVAHYWNQGEGKLTFEFTIATD